MSKFFSEKDSSLVPYTPGEQPQDKKYVKLNTNESPFPPSDKAKEYALKTSRSLNLYSAPNCVELTKELAKLSRERLWWVHFKSVALVINDTSLSSVGDNETDLWLLCESLISPVLCVWVDTA